MKTPKRMSEGNTRRRILPSRRLRDRSAPRSACNCFLPQRYQAGAIVPEPQRRVGRQGGQLTGWSHVDPGGQLQVRYRGVEVRVLGEKELRIRAQPEVDVALGPNWEGAICGHHVCEG